MKKTLVTVALMFCFVALCGATGRSCEGAPTSDDIQQAQQEQMLKDRAAAIGMPSIKNWRKARIMKDIYELQDQKGLVTYTYAFSDYQGKYTYVGKSFGYPIPGGTQFTNPQKIERCYGPRYVTIPQADPDGLFAPGSAQGTYIMMVQPDGTAMPQYMEPNMSVFTYKLPERLLTMPYPPEGE